MLHMNKPSGSVARYAGAVALAAISALIPQTPALAQDNNTLRVAIHADLNVLDPISATAGITLSHAYMIYDKLFEFDSAGIPQPQMASGYTLSDDGLVWTITLRDGLIFHDGSPVTSEDVVVSLNRWGQRDGMGRTLFGVLESLEALDEKTVQITLTEPFGLVLDAFAAIRGNPAFIMPAWVASAGPAEQITETIGSGPFVFDAEAWNPGSLVVYNRFEDYVPREEPSDFYAGAKIAHFDRVEWHYLPDSTTAMAALQTGEIDIWELVPSDIAGALEGVPGIEVTTGVPMHGLIRPNHLIPPFDKPEARQALLHLVNQADVLTAAVGNPDLWTVCPAFLTCSGAFGSDAGVVGVVSADIEKARELLEASGYDGSPIVLMDPVDLADLHAVALYVAQQLRAAGATVEVQSMDWSTLTSRRSNRETTDKGGWNLLFSYTGGAEAASPVTNIGLRSNCDDAWFGWPCDQEIEDLRRQWQSEADLEKRQQIAEAMQIRAYETVPYVPYGEYYTSKAYSSSLSDLIPRAPILVYWSVRRD